MLVGFLSDEQAARYRRYHADPSPEQLARFFYLGPLDLPSVAQRRLPPNQLGYAVQLCTLRFLGAFLPDPAQVPAIVVQMLAEQLHLAATGLEGYRKRPRCIVPTCDGVFSGLAFRTELWDKYSTAAPAQLRQYGPLSNVVRKAYKR